VALIYSESGKQHLEEYKQHLEEYLNMKAVWIKTA
jgi:hypothetical protein